jgi:CO/xanthine dehydrogenase FAD-binding subunit
VCLVDISRIAALEGVEQTDDTIAVGPLTTHTTISESTLFRSSVPFLAAASGAVGSMQIRNRGTIGGNIMNAATCADTVPPLVALGAVVTLSSASGSRTLPVEELFEKPYVTRTFPGELLTRIHFSPPPIGTTQCFLKLGRRNGVSIARLSVAACLTRDPSGVIIEARIVPGAVLPTWMRIGEAEALLIGRRPERKLFIEAGKIVSDAMVRTTGRRWSTEFKEKAVAVLVRRSLEACAAQ